MEMGNDATTETWEIITPTLMSLINNSAINIPDATINVQITAHHIVPPKGPKFIKQPQKSEVKNNAIEFLTKKRQD